MTSFDIDNISLVTLLFQAGYLTIKKALLDGVMTEYTLGFPNLEVSAAFTNSLLNSHGGRLWAATRSEPAGGGRGA